MKAKDKQLIEKLCIGICDGEDGRCQRYPRNSMTCDSFKPMAKAYKAGVQEVVEFINRNSYDWDIEPRLTISKEDWQAFLKEKGLENKDG